MNIVVYTLCYNEIYLAPFVVDYWKRFANKVIRKKRDKNIVLSAKRYCFRRLPYAFIPLSPFFRVR